MLTGTVPWIVWGFFKIITPFIDPVTREKLKFNEDMKQYVPAEQLWSSDWGGNFDFEYDHEVYWPALNELCRKKREEKLARWVAGGKIIGESEEYLAGGTDTSIKGGKFEPEQVQHGEAKQDAEKEKEVDELGEKLASTELKEDPAAVAA